MTHTTKVLPPRRNNYFDILRAVAVIFVICIHIFYRIPAVANSSSIPIIPAIWRTLIGSAVPLFIAISGYFMANKDVSTPKKYFAFIKKQIPRVYIPCFIWSLPHFYWEVRASGFSSKEVFNLLFCGYSNYYFVLLIIIFYILLPICQYLGKTKRGVFLSILISFFSISFWCYIVGKFFHFDPPYILSAIYFPMRIMFYVVGIHFGKNIGQKPVWSSNLILMIMILTTLILGGLFLSNDTLLAPIIGTSILKAIRSLYSLLVIILLFKIAPSNYRVSTSIGRLFAHLGVISYGIYLIHTHVLLYLDLFTERYLSVPTIFWLLLLILILLICIIVIYISRTINKKYSQIILGF